MSYNTFKKINIEQNQSNYILLISKSYLFKKGYLEKVLNPLNKDVAKLKIVRVLCKVKGYK